MLPVAFLGIVVKVIGDWGCTMCSDGKVGNQSKIIKYLQKNSYKIKNLRKIFVTTNK